MIPLKFHGEWLHSKVESLKVIDYCLFLVRGYTTDEINCKNKFETFPDYLIVLHVGCLEDFLLGYFCLSLEIYRFTKLLYVTYIEL